MTVFPIKNFHLYIPMCNFFISQNVIGKLSHRRMLQVNYEASGWVVHHKSDIWAKTSADQGNVDWALWPMGGAWLCTHLWDHYTYTLDKVRFFIFFVTCLWLQSICWHTNLLLVRGRL